MQALRIGLVGWGRMGAPMGARLLDAGHRLAVHDVREEARAAAAERGAQARATPAEVAADADVLVTMLPDDRVAHEAATAEGGILAGLAAGSLWLEMTSSHPAVTAELAREAASRGAELLDAPVTGGVPKAVSGELTAMVAGSAEALARAEPILSHLAAHVFHVGEQPGLGDLAKTVNNLLSATNLLAAGEGLAIALRGGLDPRALLDVVNNGTGQSNATAWKVPQYVLSGRFDSGFTLGQYLKDLEIALRVADDYELPTPLARAARQVWRDLVETDGGDGDHTAAVRLVLEASGVDLAAQP